MPRVKDRKQNIRAFLLQKISWGKKTIPKLEKKIVRTRNTDFDSGSSTNFTFTSSTRFENDREVSNLTKESRWKSRRRFTVLWLDIKENDPNLVLDGDALIQQNGNDISHVIADFFTFGVSSHGEILFDFAQFVHVTLKMKWNSNINLINSERSTIKLLKIVGGRLLNKHVFVLATSSNCYMKIFFEDTLNC